MNLIFKRSPVKESFINIYENNKITFGFTEKKFKLEYLLSIFEEYNIKELKQIHSDNIFFSSKIRPGLEGDGIILDQKKIIIIIKTADCIPLFLWNSKCSIGGIIHIGWRGLLNGIEKKLIDLLKNGGIDIKGLNFYFGPSIERGCYEVDNNLYNTFYSKNYRKNIFFKKSEKKYLMDIKKGIYLSLKESGILEKNIMDSNICTFCENHRFPSYRKNGKTENRIYNFLLLK